MAAVQMNVRIDEELKERGDAVFARAGFTPSQVVRAAWEYADEVGDIPPFMRPNDEVELSRKLKAVEEGSRRWEHFFKDQGLPVPSPSDVDYKALRDEVYDDALEEMGL